MLGPFGSSRFEHMAGNSGVPFSSPASQEPQVDAYSPVASSHQSLTTWNRSPHELPRHETPHQRLGTSQASELTVDETLASTDLQNTADALALLADVAKRDSIQIQSVATPGSGYGAIGQAMHQTPQGLRNVTGIDFLPLNNGQLSIDMLRTLLLRYESKYHPYFPLANTLAFDLQHLPTIATEESHLLTAMLTVASRDEETWWQVHKVCSTHMQTLIAELVYSGSGTVQAIEAMLILAEWVPRKLHSNPAVGRGEEDGAAWMYVGIAVRYVEPSIILHQAGRS